MTDEEAIKYIKAYCPDTKIYKNLGKAFDMAIEALERLIPKKPVCIEDKMWTCPTCCNNLLWKWKKYPTELTPVSEGLNYCLSCGQKIDWSEE